ncbi:ABC transporter permease [Chitinophaga barathri]|uniref:FtsX-like permease family protein n=1 Tax=Chitinophaga barathri TaxID=1647451 RepID=A0A3N4MBW6_9BACT|nr:FtsX-like permease family protein [Chitinophaga barathri]RPD41374.1 FtsX-like permease family protein [Chitinophaga barathri]
MLTNYLKIAWRNLLKNKTFSIINIIGLAIGMATCIMILLFVSYEKNFDGMHKKNIYRLCEVQKPEGLVAPQNVALSMYPMATALKLEYPEVKNFVRINDGQDLGLTYKDKHLYLKKMNWVDSTFFQIFDFPLLEGDRNSALMKPGSMVITTETAKKLFGNENPMGKTVTRYPGDTVALTITGVMEMPANSHLQFEALISMSTVYNPRWEQNWGGNWLVTYLELDEKANIAGLESKFPAFCRKYLAEEDRWKNYELFLQPLADVHAASNTITHDYNNFQKFDRRYTYIFSFIAILILVIACINFVNLSTARSAERAREVGIRKSMGAHRSQLAWQFMGESVMLSLIALVFAVAIVKISLPWVNDFAGRPLSLPIFSNFILLIGIITGTVLVGILAGLYPAGYLSSFQPVKVLKGSVMTGKNKSLLRNALVIGQFTGAVFLIIATVFALKQLKYMQTKDRGFNGDQVLLVPLDNEANTNYAAMKQELLGSSLISGVSGSQQRLGNNLHQTSVVYHGEGPARELVTSQVVVDKDFMSLYKIPMAAGSNFSKEITASNGREYIINETLARELLKNERMGGSLESLVGKMFGFMGMDSTGRIVGVARDFNFNSLHHKIETLLMLNQSEWGFSEMSVRISGGRTKEAVALVESVWKKHVTKHPFTYSFLDEHFAQIYRSDSQVSSIVTILAVLAIIVSCLGLFGLASYSAERRVKEIGIRKVLGATVENIVTMLSKDFVKLVIIANLIAWPIAFFAVRLWLQDFAYRVDISWWIFAAAGIIAIFIALFTVSFQALRAARSNPMQSLKID